MDSLAAQSLYLSILLIMFMSLMMGVVMGSLKSLIQTVIF